jgi:thiol-disulfide isomerase/thioredoxin
MNRRNLILGASGATALSGGAWLASRSAPTDIHPALLALYEGKVLNVDGKGYPIAALRGKAVLLNVWAPWCAPCVEELPELSVLSQSSAAKSVQFIGLGVDNAQNISDFSIKHPVSFPLLVAGMAGTQLAKSLGNASGALPFTVLFNAAGHVLGQKTGRVRSDEIVAWIAKIV